MHVQPEAANIQIASKPTWAVGAADHLASLIKGRVAPVRVLEFGSGGSTQFMLNLGAYVTAVEHHESWAQAVADAAKAAGTGDRLTMLSRPRPYFDVVDELDPEVMFDVLVVDGRERMRCLDRGRERLRATGVVVVGDSERRRYWHAHTVFGALACMTFVDPKRQTSIWQLSEEGRPDFATKAYEGQPATDSLIASQAVVPREIYSNERVAPGFQVSVPMRIGTDLENQLQDQRLIAKASTYVSPKVYRLSGAEVTIQEGKKFLRHNGLTFRTATGELDPADPSEIPEGTVFLKGRSLDISAPGAGRYAFFLLDSLPKLRIAEELGHELNDFDHIIVNSGAPWLTSILTDRFGVDRKRLKPYNRNASVYGMETSVHIEGIRKARFTPIWVRDFIRGVFTTEPPARAKGLMGIEGTAAQLKRFLKGGGSAPDGRRVYISRQRSSGRRVVNDEDFGALLKKLGFLEVFAEDYSPDALSKVLAKTEVLASPHGAGLANMIFCPPNTRVIEFFGVHFTPQYKYLADELGHRYVPICCTDPNGETVFNRQNDGILTTQDFNRRDLIVPLDEFEAAVNAD